MTYYPTLGVSQPALMDILNTISDIVFTIARDDDGMWRFTMVNQRFLEATGLKPDAVFGQRVIDVVPRPAHDLVLSKYEEAIATRRPVQWEEVSVYPSGTKVGHVTVVAMFDAQGMCRTIVGWVHDATECARRAALVAERQGEKQREP